MADEKESKMLIKSSLENLGIVRSLKNIKSLLKLNSKNIKKDKDFNEKIGNILNKIDELTPEIEDVTKKGSG